MAAARLTFVSLAKQTNIFNNRDVLFRMSNALYIKRSFSNVPLEFSDRDPAPLFFSPNIQKLLKYLTRPDIGKVFRKRNNKNEKYLSVPEYKFMTDAELKAEMEKVSLKADRILLMPPVIKVRTDAGDEIANDPALRCHDSAKFVFTDITFGTRNSERFIIVREPDGQLHHADHEIRKRLNQVYFPMAGRMLKEPAMFTDNTLFEDLLTRKEYEFILDRASIQYEPYDPTYQSIVAKTYIHCDDSKDYDCLRSTRHFGPMTFYLAWNNIIDNLILEMLQTGAIREGVSLINLQRKLNPHSAEVDDSQSLVDEILNKVKDITAQSNAVEIDLNLDEKCIPCVSKYIEINSIKKGQLELALQAYEQMIKQKIAMDQGLRAAHGI